MSKISTKRFKVRRITGTALDELFEMRYCFAFFFIVLSSVNARAAESDTTVTVKSESQRSKTKFDLAARLANESNWADGVSGPVTYGLIGDVIAQTGLELDATFVRMHEPGMTTFNSVLDEGQLSLKYPLSEAINISGTFWKNRMMDMYTTVVGIEVQRSLEPLSLTLGVYSGTASRFEAEGRYLGAGLEIGAEIGKLEIALSHFAGLIHTPTDPSTLGVGKYHKSALEAAIDLNESIKFPLRTTFGVERRYFDFGSGGPVSEPIDTWIVVVGAEIGLTSLLQPE